MYERLNASTLAGCTTEIVASFVAHQSVAISDLPGLIELVGRQLTTLGATSEPEPEALKPAVSIKRSVQDDHLVCLLCGRQRMILKRHLHTAHQLTPDEYRALFKLKPDYPMTAPGYAETRSKLAKQIGLGQKKEDTKKAKPKSRRKR